MTEVVYEVTLGDGQTSVVKTRAEAEDLVSKHGGSFKQNFNYQETLSEGFCRKDRRTPIGTRVR